MPATISRTRLAAAGVLLTVLGATVPVPPATAYGRASVSSTSKAAGQPAPTPPAPEPLRNPDLIVVLDRGYAKKAQQWQTLWHLPSDQGATVYSRTTAIATKAGDSTRTIVFQVPFRQALPAGATLTQRGLTTPRIQGWHFPTDLVFNAAPTVLFARSAPSASILSVIVPIRQAAGVGYTLTPAANGWTNLNLTVGGIPVRVRISPGNWLGRG